MALRTPSEAKTARRIGIGWMALTALGAIVTALVGIVYFAGDPAKEIKDPETVFLLLSQIFFHPFVAGLVLAAVLAAIMSTMSSQLIVCSSALVEDLYNIAGKKLSPKREVALGRSGVLVVAVVASVLALNRDSSILDLVGFAWAGFGAAFGPIVLLSLYWRKLTSTGALAGMITGAATVFVWGNITRPARCHVRDRPRLPAEPFGRRRRFAHDLQAQRNDRGRILRHGEGSFRKRTLR